MHEEQDLPLGNVVMVQPAPSHLEELSEFPGFAPNRKQWRWLLDNPLFRGALLLGTVPGEHRRILGYLFGRIETEKDPSVLEPALSPIGMPGPHGRLEKLRGTRVLHIDDLATRRDVIQSVGQQIRLERTLVSGALLAFIPDDCQALRVLLPADASPADRQPFDELQFYEARPITPGKTHLAWRLEE